MLNRTVFRYFTVNEVKSKRHASDKTFEQKCEIEIMVEKNESVYVSCKNPESLQSPKNPQKGRRNWWKWNKWLTEIVKSISSWFIVLQSFTLRYSSTVRHLPTCSSNLRLSVLVPEKSVVNYYWTRLQLTETHSAHHGVESPRFVEQVVFPFNGLQLRVLNRKDWSWSFVHLLSRCANDCVIVSK